MPSRSIIQTSFAAGTISPRLFGRSDLQKYYQGAEKIENFLVMKHGGITRRPGTQYVSDCFDSGTESRLIPFEINSTDTYIVEIPPNGLTSQKIRIFREGILLKDSSDAAIEIDISQTTPYSVGQIRKLKFTQSNDILFVFSEDFPIYQLKRAGVDTDPASWSWEELEFEDGPYDPLNPTDEVKVEFKAATQAQLDQFGISGTGGFEVDQVINIFNTTPGSTVFSTGDAGRLFAVDFSDEFDTDDTPATTATIRRGVCEILLVDGDAIFGKIKKRFVEQTQDDGSGAQNNKKAQPSADWRFGGFSADKTGYPRTGRFHQQRLVVAGTRVSPNRLWLSTIDRFNNFGPSDPEDISVVDATRAIDATIADNQTNSIQDLSSDARGLVIHTLEGEFVGSASSTFSPISPTDFQVLRQGRYGVQPDVPVQQIGDRILFVQNGGNRVRELGFSFESDRYQARDITIMCDNVGRSAQGNLLFSTYQQNPDSTAFFVRGDGALVGLTYERAENVFAFHEHFIGKHDPDNVDVTAKVLSVASVREGDNNSVYMVVKRDGLFTIERLSQIFQFEDEHKDARFLDGYTVINNATATTAISGQTRFANQTISALVDGATISSVTFDSSGNATLPFAGSTVVLGYKYTSRMKTVPLAAPRVGAAQNDLRNSQATIFKAFLRLHRSLSGKVGVEKLDEIDYRTPANNMDTAIPLFTGMLEQSVGSSSDRQPQLTVELDTPQPFTLLMLSLETDLGGVS